MNYNIKDTHISLIQPGDTVIHYGTMKTVTKPNISGGFCGKTLWGDSYMSGHRPVKLVQFKTKGRQS